MTTAQMTPNLTFIPGHASSMYPHHDTGLGQGSARKRRGVMRPCPRDDVRSDHIAPSIRPGPFEINVRRFMLQQSIHDSQSLVEIVPEDHHWRLNRTFQHKSWLCWSESRVSYAPPILLCPWTRDASALKANTPASRRMKRHLIIFNLCFQA